MASKGVQLIIKIWEFLALGDSLGRIQVLLKVLAPYKAIKAPQMKLEKFFVDAVICSASDFTR